MTRTLQFGSTLQPDPALQQDARYSLNREDRQQIDTQIRELQTFASRAHLNGAHGTYLKLVGSDGAAGDVVCSADGLSGAPTVKVATAAALSSAGIALGVLLEATRAGSKALVALGGVIAPTITGLAAAAPGWVRVDAAGRCERVDTLADDDIALGHVDAGGYLTLGIHPSSVAGSDLAAEKLLVDGTTSSLANARTLGSLTATIPIVGHEVQPLSLTRRGAANAAETVLSIGRTVTNNDPGAVGQAASVAFFLTDAGHGNLQAGRLRYELTDAAVLNQTAKAVLSVLGNDGEKDYLTLGGGDGVLLNGLGGSAVSLKAEAHVASLFIGGKKRTGTGLSAGTSVSVLAPDGQDVAAGTNNIGGALMLRSGSPGTGGTGGSSGALTLGSGSFDVLTSNGPGSTQLDSQGTLSIGPSAAAIELGEARLTGGSNTIAANDTTPDTVATITSTGAGNTSAVCYAYVFGCRNDTQKGYHALFRLFFHVTAGIATIDSLDVFMEGDNTALGWGSGDNAVVSFTPSGANILVQVTMPAASPASSWKVQSGALETSL